MVVDSHRAIRQFERLMNSQDEYDFVEPKRREFVLDRELDLKEGEILAITFYNPITKEYWMTPGLTKALKHKRNFFGYEGDPKIVPKEMSPLIYD